MALKTFVKVSGVNNLSDARYCSGMEVNQLGFSIDNTQPNYTDSEKFKEIKGWLSGVDFVGEVGSNPGAPLAEVVAAYELDALQVTTSDQVAEAASIGLPVILKTDVSMITESSLQALKPYVSYFLLESFHQGEVSPEILELAQEYPLVVAYGITAENAEQLAATDLKGLGLHGGDEISPGLRDFDEMMDILEALEIDDTL